MKPAIQPSFTALVGVDWSDRKHDFCLQAAGSPQREFGVLVHSPEAIALWAKALYRRFGGRIAVCLDIAKGPLVHALQRHEFIVLFPVNPPRWPVFQKKAENTKQPFNVSVQLGRANAANYPEQSITELPGPRAAA